MVGIDKVERILDVGAAAWLGLCVAYALFAVSTIGLLNGAVVAVAGGALVAVATYHLLLGLGSVALSLPGFHLVSDDWIELQCDEDSSGELLLTDLYVENSDPFRTDSELLLDDVLAELHTDSRVVQLFDPARTPTAGELKARIDRHLRRGRPASPEQEGADASQALYDALADLRRSLA